MSDPPVRPDYFRAELTLLWLKLLRKEIGEVMLRTPSETMHNRAWPRFRVVCKLLDLLIKDVK